MHVSRIFKRRGQVIVLYALLIPMLLFALGVGLDLGWYYLNVSRLQNAADAAVVAGAQKLLGEDDFKDYHGVRLVAQYPADNPDETIDTTAGDEVAARYALKNLSSDAEAIHVGDNYEMTSNYSRGGDPTITMKPSLYKDADDNFYYVVNLAEDIHHFFIGWLDDMKAPVVAVAMLTKTEEDPAQPDPLIEAMETAKNENVMIGNWEIQNKYRVNDKTLAAYKEAAGHDLYMGAWNHFKSEKNYYKTGNTYRTETVNIFDDVKTDEAGNVIDDHKNRDATNDQNPNVSSVKKTDAAINKRDSSSHTYNPEGMPYTWDKLDSINIDTTGDMVITNDSGKLTDTNYIVDGDNKYISEDWDLEMGYYDHVGNGVNWDKLAGDTKKLDYVQNRNQLRIHTSINFGTPYPVRPDFDYPDVLWTRIESEPMFYKWNGTVLTRTLNSVRQFIININGDNTVKETVTVTDADGNETTEERYKYRPVIMFYDGPESYSNSSLRQSQPVILNLNTDFRGILYAPNSSVVLIDNNKNFYGFIVAKNYLRLKTTADFEAEMNANPDKYEKFTRNGTTVYREKEKTQNKYLGDTRTQINMEYIKIQEADGNGGYTEMYVDLYGNVQYMELSDKPMKYGTYDTFGRTDFITHDYQIAPESASNLLFSGK